MLEEEIPGAGSQEWTPVSGNATGDPSGRVPGLGKALVSPAPSASPVAVTSLMRTRLGWGPLGEKVLLAGPGCFGDIHRSRGAQSRAGCWTSRVGGSCSTGPPEIRLISFDFV